MKIGIIGAGLVGSTTAYTLATQGLAEEIVLVDINRERAVAEAADITHAAAFNNDCRIAYGDYISLKDAGIVIITADGGAHFENSRLELLDVNGQLFRTIIPKIAEFAPNSIILIATNPVDVMTLLAFHISGFPKERIIGSGTLLDSIRFRAILANYLEVSPQSVNAMVIGEHGDSEVVSWSSATVGVIPLEEFAQDTGHPLNETLKHQIAEDVVKAGYNIYLGKKATYYGIASSLTAICKAIIRNERRVLPVSSFHEDVEGLRQVCLSLPTIIGRQGIIKAVLPQLYPEEMDALRASADILCEAQQRACPVFDN